MEFNISGQISFSVNFDIEASSEEDAKKQALELIIDFYHLHSGAPYHTDSSLEMDIYADECKD